ncbi:MAG: hypothetical protein BAJATHORv1_50087 [Candidatus Thorarchaeota archaeon]|nr:MAG: hypothetical protein BAJATHORv1_50087 [Candidatus Thorarchaeota archaeon]
MRICILALIGLNVDVFLAEHASSQFLQPVQLFASMTRSFFKGVGSLFSRFSIILFSPL